MQDQSDVKVNSHVEAYLDYYCGLAHSPGFAILLKGQWGSGKTWFINQYCEKLEKNNQKYLYISLYGMSTISEIEDKFFQLLHPILSSRGMAVTGIIVKGLLKGALKIDLNNDGKDDGTWNIQIPEINLPKHLEDVNKSVLIFDDLERCNIEIPNLLGYINHFVEHQDLKVILIANEDELYKNVNYKSIKEKLIGRTFAIAPDFDSALEIFIEQMDNEKAKAFLSKNSILIKELYEKAEYENLRNLRQIVLDFQRIFENLPEKAQQKPEILSDILRLLLAFSIEIKRGLMLPSDISKLQEEHASLLRSEIDEVDKIWSRRENPETSIIKTESNKELLQQKILKRYSFLDIHEPFPSATWWQIFFDQGVIDVQELEKSIFSSKHFQDENTPDWIRLWHFSDLSDDDFSILLSKVETAYNSRKFRDLGVIKHIFGLLLMFSDAEVYTKSKQEILKESKKYIDDLKHKGCLDPLPYSIPLPTAIGQMFGSYLNLGFQGMEFQEFKEFCEYLKQAQRLVKIEKMPEDAQSILDAMQSDIWKFHHMISFDGSYREYSSEPKYCEIPILHHISPTDFVGKILGLSHREQQHVFGIINERYKHENINNKLLEELDWLKAVRASLLNEADNRKGKLSGLCLRALDTHYLKEAIEKLEQKENRQTIQ